MNDLITRGRNKGQSSHKDLPQASSRGLTVRFVNQVGEPGKYHDNQGHGLLLRVTKSLSKQWIQRIMFEGRKFELGLGSPPVVTLAEARDKAIDNKRLLRAGGDPRVQKQQKVDQPTFEDAAALACEVQSYGKGERYHIRFMGCLKLHVFPSIGGMKISDVSSKDIITILNTVYRKSYNSGVKAQNYLGVVMQWGVSNDFVAESPMARAIEGLPKYVSSNKHRKSLPYNLVNELVKKLKGSQAEDNTKLALEFLILVAGRSGEIRNAVWSEFDFEKRLWTIPASRMKMSRDHKVPLSDRAMEILELAKENNSGSDLVFATPRGKPMSDMTLSQLVKKGLKYNYDVHGFRASFRTWSQGRTDYNREAAELALAHVVGNKTEQAYARYEYLPERVKLLQDWADYLKIPSEKHKMTLE